jgi:hypothetical protein
MWQEQLSTLFHATVLTRVVICLVETKESSSFFQAGVRAADRKPYLILGGIFPCIKEKIEAKMSLCPSRT